MTLFLHPTIPNLVRCDDCGLFEFLPRATDMQTLQTLQAVLGGLMAKHNGCARFTLTEIGSAYGAAFEAVAHGREG